MADPETQALLNIILDGPEVQAGRMPVDALVVVLNKIQLCVKRLGQVLMGEESKATKGRIKAPIEESCRLEVMTFVGGSFGVCLDLQDKQDLGSTGYRLGEEAVSILVSGLRQLGDSNSRIVDEFGPGVLAALKDVSQVLDRGIDTISLTYKGNGNGPLQTTIDRRVRDRILVNIAEPTEAPYTLKGSLKEVDLVNNNCRIYTSKRKFINCKYDEQLEPEVREALDKFVFAQGKATRDGPTNRVIEFHIRELKVAIGRSESDLLAGSGTLPRTGAELLDALTENGFIGMWKDREDMVDSSRFARKLRDQQAETGQEG